MKTDAWDYRPTPFWFVNHQLEKDEIELQVKLMADAGCGGFFIHPRGGLKTPYLSDAWFEAVRWAVAAAEKHGIKAWLYDEDPFPSGAVGGTVFFEHPEFLARHIRFFEFTPDAAGRLDADIGKGVVLTAVAVRSDRKGKVLEQRDLRGMIGVIRPDFFQSPWSSSYYVQIFGKREFKHFRAETFYPRMHIAGDLRGSGWKVYITTHEVAAGSEKYGGMPDNLNPKCVGYFIEKTHERYRQLFGDKFGTVIPGIFTDEPAVGVTPPWTAGLEKQFINDHGYALAGNYQHLFATYDPEIARKIRRDYWHTVDALFNRNYFGQLQRWCRKNQLMLVGHCIGEENPLATIGGTDLPGIQHYFDVPGFDHITGNIPQGDFQSLNLGGKVISSTAARLGKKRVLSECFGCNAFNFGPDGMKKIANWLFALGINWLVPHGFYYSGDGYRKLDAGKSFFFQDPDFNRFGEFSRYAASIGQRLGETRSVNHVCMLIPSETIRGLLPAEANRAAALCETFFAAVGKLLAHQVQFDLAEEHALRDGRFVNGRLVCGRQKYDTLIILRSEEPPVDPLPEVAAWRRQGLKIIDTPEQFGELPSLAGLGRIVADDGGGPELMVDVRKSADGEQLYVFNNRAEPAEFRIEWNKAAPYYYVYDPETDVRSRFGNGSTEIRLGGFAAVFIERDKRNVLDAADYCAPRNLRPVVYAYETAPQWDYLPPGDHWIAAITRWKITVRGKELQQEAADQSFSLLRNIFGTELSHMTAQRPRPIFDLAPLRPALYPLHAVYETEFQLTASEAAAPGLQLVWERETMGGRCRLFVNNVPLPDGVRTRIYDPWNYAAPLAGLCRAGTNRLKIVWENAGEFDGLRSAFYLSC